MDADNLVTTVALAAEHDFAKAKEVANRFVKVRNEKYRDMCLKVIKMFNKVEKNNIRKRIFPDLLKGTLELYICEALEMTEKEFINEMSKLHPHPVYIHLVTCKLSVGNFVAGEE